MILVVANLKGGVGKTTSAVFLAEAAAERNERVLLVDGDAQGSAKGWFERAAADGMKLRSEAIALSTPELGRRLASLGGYDTIVIDTPPGNLDVIRAAISAATVVVVPCQPALLDLDRLSVTLDLAGQAGRPAAVLLTRTRFATRSLAGAQSVLDEAEAPLLSTVIPQREAIAATYGERPEGWMLDLYVAVLDEIEAALG